MSHSDKKINQALNAFEWRDGKRKINQNQAVEQIKQALKDAGYATVDKRKYRDEKGKEFTQYTIVYADGTGEFVRLPPFTSLTAQEWYRKFSDELKVALVAYPEGGDEESAMQEYWRICDIAKKAAGIE